MTDNFNIFIFKISVIEIHISILKIIPREPDFKPIGLSSITRSHDLSDTKRAVVHLKLGAENFYLTWFIISHHLGKAFLSCLLCVVWADVFWNFSTCGRQLQFQPNICLEEGLAHIIQRKTNIQLSDLSKARKIEFLWLLWLPANDLHNSPLSVWICRGKTLSPLPRAVQYTPGTKKQRNKTSVRLIQKPLN